MSALTKKRKDSLVAATFALVVREGWDAITPRKLALKAKLPLKIVAPLFDSPEGLISLVVLWVDQQVAPKARSLSEKDSFQDRLFEISMARLDILENNRAAFLAITEHARRTPPLAKQLLRAQRISLASGLSLASKSGQKTTNKLFDIGYFVAFHLALERWRTEKEAPIEKAMTTLDRALRKLFSHFFSSTGGI